MQMPSKIPTLPALLDNDDLVPDLDFPPAHAHVPFSTTSSSAASPSAAAPSLAIAPSRSSMLSDSSCSSDEDAAPDHSTPATLAAAAAAPLSTAAVAQLRACAVLAGLTGRGAASSAAARRPSSSSSAARRLAAARGRRAVALAPPSEYTVLQEKAKVVSSQNADLEAEREALLRQQEELKTRLATLRGILLQLGVDPDRMVPDCA